MSNNSNKNTSSGIGFTGFLTIVFITLKLMNIIHWSWLWVISPIWITLVLWLIGLVIFITVEMWRHN